MLQHLAIIMDGNGRWAKQHGVSVSDGHKQGAETAKRTAQNCIEKGIKYLTLYTFSSENWKRDESEVSAIIDLLKYYLDRDSNELIENGVNLRFIGDLSAFPDAVIEKCESVAEASKGNDKLYLSIALNYGGRQEIVNAMQEVIEENLEANIENISNKLYTAPYPDPDLLVRTGGDQRVSNFLLWQMAYTEFYFTETLWPDFDMKCLEEAEEDFSKRERRFGGR